MCHGKVQQAQVHTVAAPVRKTLNGTDATVNDNECLLSPFLAFGSIRYVVAHRSRPDYNAVGTWLFTSSSL